MFCKFAIFLLPFYVLGEACGTSYKFKKEVKDRLKNNQLNMNIDFWDTLWYWSLFVYLYMHIFYMCAMTRTITKLDL